jgi:lysozyme
MKINQSIDIQLLSGEMAKELQSLLNNHGYALARDGIVGQKTIAAFNDFKEKNHLGFPNFLGDTTLKKLMEAPQGRRINQAGLNLIKQFEGFRSKAYLCPAKVWTIGYGSTFYPNGRRVKSGDVIDRAQGEELLKATVKTFESGVDRAVTVPLTNNQFSALVSFAFNVGLGAFRGSTLLRVLNRGNYQEAANQLLRWDKAGGRKLAGLTRRRKAERKLFLS